MESITIIVGIWIYTSLQALPFVSFNCPSKLANNPPIDGISAPIAPPTRKIAKGLLPTDERIDRGDCGEGHEVWGCFLRGPFFYVEIRRVLTLYS